MLIYPDDWEVKKLGDIGDVTKLAGFEFTEHVKYSNIGKIIALRGLNVKHGTLILDDVKYIDNSDLSKCKFHWSDILKKTLSTGHNYVEDYTNGAIEVSKKCDIDVKKLSDVPSKVWDYVYEKIV